MGKKGLMKDIFSLREMINNLFEDTHFQMGFEYTIWTPFIDMYETSEFFVVQAELPEVMESDISIRVEGNTLKINGQRRLQREGRSYHQVERSYGLFSRSFILSSAVDENGIKATLKDGMLKIVLPKKNIDSPKHVEIA